MDACRETIGNCLCLIGNLAVLLGPFLPFSSEKVLSWLNLEPKWEPQKIARRQLPEDFGILFSRI